MAQHDSDQSNRIEQIRQLIFGEQAQEIDRRFDALQKEIIQLKKALELELEKQKSQLKQLSQRSDARFAEAAEALEQTEQRLRAALGDLREEVQRRLDALSNDKIDRMELGNMLIEIGLRLKKEDILDSLNHPPSPASAD
ncbi:MAG: hypothetical protein D6715_04540 [Calditrichaeota bacterium]|nr:MAG: hypothetical protein D6715_04540 [Calditrichota bacterium]